MLDIAASDKGLLIPRVSLTGQSDNTTIPSPTTGLMVYNTNTAGSVTPGFYFWNGSEWQPLGSTAYTFENGLTENSSHAVGLGGTLSSNTTINFGSGAFGNNLIFNLVSSSSQFTIQDDGTDNAIFYNSGNVEFKGNISTGEYMNFGSTFGSTGYGFRTRSGDLQYRRNTSEDWTDFPAAVSGTPYWWYRPTDSIFIRPQNNDNIRIYDDSTTYGLYFNGSSNQYGGFFRTTGSYDTTAAVVGFSDVSGNTTYGFLGYDGTWTNSNGDFSLDGAAVYGMVEDRGRASIFGRTTRDASYAAIIGYSDVWISGYYYTRDADDRSSSHPALYGQLLVDADKSGNQAAIESWSEYIGGVGNRGYTVGGDFTAYGWEQDSKGIEVRAKSYGTNTVAYGVLVEADSADYLYGVKVNTGTNGINATSSYGVYATNYTSDGTGILGIGSGASNVFISGSGDGVVGISDAGFGVFGQYDDGSGNLNIYGVLGHDTEKANYFYHNETTTTDGQSAGYFYRTRDAQNDGTAYWHNNTNQALEAYNPYGDSYTFGVSGFSWDDGNGRTGGVLGALYISSSNYAWASLGYESSGHTDYGVYYTSYGNGSGKNTIHSSIGMGGYGDLMGAWIRGNVYGLTVKADRYSLYIDGKTFTNNEIINLTDIGDNKRVATYVPTTDKPKIYLSGIGQLNNGKATIIFDKKYERLISDNEPVIVTVTPISECNGLHLTSSKSTGFTVSENGKGSSDIQFTWIAIATKKGYENSKLPEEVVSADFDKKIDGLMFPESDTEHSAQPFWWDGKNLRTSKPNVPKSIKNIEQPKILKKVSEPQKDSPKSNKLKINNKTLNY
jgi:hypothetical protein